MSQERIWALEMSYMERACGLKCYWLRPRGVECEGVERVTSIRMVWDVMKVQCGNLYEEGE